MPTEQVLEGIVYRTGVLNAKEQFHIARRLAPIIGAMASSAGTTMFNALAAACAQLEDKDVDFVMRTTMKIVTRQQGNQFLPVWNVAADIPQFADMNMSILLQLMIAVIQDQLGGFTPGPVDPGSAQLATGPNVH